MSDKERSDSPENIHFGKRKMNFSGTTRLKRSSKSYLNPLSPSTPASTVTKSIDVPRLDFSTNDSESEDITLSYSEEQIKKSENREDLEKILLDLQRNHSKLEKELHKLQLIRQHHHKNTPEELSSLTQKWTTAGQCAIRRLYEKLPEPKPEDLQSFMSHLQIDPNHLKYNSELDIFE